MVVKFLAVAALATLSGWEIDLPADTSFPSSADIIDCGFAVIQVSRADQKKLATTWKSKDLKEDLCNTIYPLVLATTQMGFTPESFTVETPGGHHVQIILVKKRLRLSP